MEEDSILLDWASILQSESVLAKLSVFLLGVSKLGTDAKLRENLFLIDLEVELGVDDF